MSGPRIVARSSSTQLRHGMALVAVLALLAMLGLMVAGAISTTVLLQRGERMAARDAPLIAAADYAIGNIVGDATAFGLSDLSLGVRTEFDVAIPSAEVPSARVAVTRFLGNVYWIVARAADRVGGAQRTIAVVARAGIAGVAPPTSLVARDGISVSAGVSLLADTATEVDCRATNSPAPLQTADSTMLFARPAQRSALDSAPGVRRVAHDTAIAGGSYDGILIVDGDVTLGGGFALDGLLIASGAVHSVGSLRVDGAVVSGAMIDIQGPGAVVRYSPCVVARRLRRAARVTIARERGWAEVF